MHLGGGGMDQYPESLPLHPKVETLMIPTLNGGHKGPLSLPAGDGWVNVGLFCIRIPE